MKLWLVLVAGCTPAPGKLGGACTSSDDCATGECASGSCARGLTCVLLEVRDCHAGVERPSCDPYCADCADPATDQEALDCEDALSPTLTTTTTP